MKKLITTMAVVLVAASVAQADVLALWEIEQDGSLTTAPVTGTAAGITSTALAVAPASTRFSTGIGWPDAIGTVSEDWRLSNAIEYALQENSYFGFTLTPDAGKTVNFDNLFARVSVNTGSAASSDVTFTLMSSQTGFDTNGVLGSLNVTTAAAGYGSTAFTTDFDLTGEAALQGVATATEFRIYFNSAGGNRMALGGAWGLPDDTDLQVDGTVIPEPGTLGLLGFAAAGMFWFRKRFSR